MMNNIKHLTKQITYRHYCNTSVIYGGLVVLLFNLSFRGMGARRNSWKLGSCATVLC